MARKTGGFTLIELMIVVAIIGILASYAVAQYQLYTIRARVTTGLSLTASLKSAITETFLSNGPSDMTCNTDVTCTALGASNLSAANMGGNPDVFSITSDSTGAISVNYEDDVLPGGFDILILYPVGDDGSTVMNLNDIANAGRQINWSCSTGGTVAAKYRPSVCR